MRPISRHFTEDVGSTNDLAKTYAATHAGERAVFVAARQSAGRGRMGRTFLSPEGGLYMSLLCAPAVPAAEAVRLTVQAAVVTARVLEELTGHTVSIKWVNDLYMNGKKIAGILTEGALAADGIHLAYAIVGIGINLAHTDFPGELAQLATAVEDATGVLLLPEAVERRLTAAFFATDVTDPAIMEDYRRRSMLIGEQVIAYRGEERFSCLVQGIADDGALLVLRDDGRTEALSSGEVRVKKQ